MERWSNSTDQNDNIQLGAARFGHRKAGKPYTRPAAPFPFLVGMHGRGAMSLKNKVGLPVLEECLLHQAIIWLASGELPIDPAEEMYAFGGWPHLDHSTYGEPMEALLLALRSGRLSATGIFYGDKADPREDTTMKINCASWEWHLVDWDHDTLNFSDQRPDQNGYFICISVSTKELFDIFDSGDEKQNDNRRGRKPKYDWNAFYVEIAVRADLDNLPDTAAELQRDMADWCQDTWGKVPGDTMLKEKIAPIYRHPRRGR